MRKLYFQHPKAIIFFFLFSLIVFSPHRLHAFSIKYIDIKSKFGDPFHGDVLVLNDGKSGLKVEIGTPSDYQKLGLRRKPPVDTLMVDEDYSLVGPGEQLVRVYSKSPIFYPSFDLVLKATIEGNTIVENYFLAVDFKTSLNIGIVEKKKKKVVRKKKKEKETTPLVMAKAKEEPKFEEITEEPVSMPVESAEPETPPITEAPIEEFPMVEKKIEEKSPVVTWVEKEKSTVPEPPELPKKEVKEIEWAPKPKLTPTASSATRLIETTRYGDTLFKVAQRLVKNKRNLNRAVAVLWSMNKEKFVHGNMNTLKSNVELDYTGLETAMATLSPGDAKAIIKSQWEKFLKKQWEEFRPVKLLLTEKKKVEEPRKPLKLVYLPGEINSSKNKVLEKLHQWKELWQKEALEQYIQCYSSMFQARGRTKVFFLPDWKAHKHRIFSSQEEISITIMDIQIRKERDHYFINFFQNYKSDKLNSFGLKSLDFINENGEWKIFREGFEKIPAPPQKLKRYFPYVVHVDAYATRDEAINKVNFLRRLGYSAYLVPLHKEDQGTQYQVLMERFSAKVEGDYYSSSLINLQLTPNALTIKLPFALEVASYGSESDAYKRIRELRAKGFSSYLFSVEANDGNGLAHRVLVGSYETQEQAAYLSSQLKEQGIEHQIIEP